METKFRLFDRENKTTINVRSLEFVGEHIHATSEGSPYRYLIGADADLVRFTGYKDKNGVDIWEGDILRYQENYEDSTDYVVSWGEFTDCCYEGMTWLLTHDCDALHGSLADDASVMYRVGSSLNEP